MRTFVAGTWSDAQHATRVYLQTPLSSAFAVGGLAMAIACVAALLPIFSELLLKSHAGFSNGSQLVTLGQTDGSRLTRLSLETLEQIENKAVSLQSVAGVHLASLSAEYRDHREAAAAELVTREYFSGLRPRMRLGRGFEEADHRPGAEPVAVLSHAMWQRVFAGRRDVLGSLFAVSGKPSMVVMTIGRAASPPTDQSSDYRVVGVLAPEASGTFDTTDFWLPFEQAAPLFVATGPLQNKVPVLHGLGRLRAGATPVAARAEIAQITPTLSRSIGDQNTGRLDVIPGAVRDISAQRDAQRQVRLFLAGGVLLALVAAANVSLFLMSRAPSRQRELSIRSAVGASMRRLIRQLVTEAGLLVLLATLLGWCCSLWLLLLVQEQSWLAQAQLRAVSPYDWRVLVMMFLLALALAAFVSLAPIIGLRRTGIAAGARLFSARAGWTQRVAGTVQIVIAGVVVSTALAFAWQLQLLSATDIGFNPADVQVVSTKPAEGQRFGLSFNPQETLVRRERQRATLSATPGVHGVAFGSSVPGRLSRTFVRLADPRLSGDPIEVQMIAADQAYRPLLDMRIVHGGDLDASDPGSVLVNEALAYAMWGHTDVAGETLGAMGGKVIGVVKNTAYVHPADEIKPMMYRMATPMSAREFILVRGSLSSAQLRDVIQKKIDRGELEFQLADVESLADIWNETLAPDRARAWLTSISASMVVVLAALGFYGTQAYLVNAGRREYAIRAAVGAGPRALGRLVMWRGLMLGLPGLILATAGAAIAVAWLGDGFIAREVSPTRVVLLTELALFVLVMLTALDPARRARRMQPAPQLREE
jgi:ABC-type antimicrobial peptide transport system permease subunit